MIIRRLRQTALLLLSGIGLIAAQPTHAQELLKKLPLGTDQAHKIGLERRTFSFDLPSLNFETTVPINAQISTLPYTSSPIEAGQIGRTLPIGQMRIVFNDIAIKDSIFSYELRFPPAALRTCKWQMQEDGFFIAHTHSVNELSEAQLFGMHFTPESGEAKQARFAYCYARGKILIAHYFTAELPKDTNTHDKIISALRDTASYFASNMRFADGRPNSIDDDMIEHFAVDIDGQFMTFDYPKGLELIKDDAKSKTLPYQLHITQKLQSGIAFSHLSFWVDKAREPATEENMRQLADTFTHNFIQRHLPIDDTSNQVSEKFISRNSVPGFGADNIMARSYQYHIINQADPEQPKLFYITVVNHRGRNYVLFYYSRRSPQSNASEYFTGSAGDVGYDMLRNSLHKFLKTQK